MELPEHEDPEIVRTAIRTGAPPLPTSSAPVVPTASAPAPPPTAVYEGLDRFTWGAGSPPDTNGDVGPTYYIQTVNTSIGIYRKSTGVQEAAFTFNTFMSQGNFGNLCDTNNFGDPVVLYDTFEDRWVITDFAFVLDGGGNVLAPSFQCFGVSQTGDPILGGWNFYSIQLTDALNDYPKLGVWPDGLYMSSNMFSFGAGSTFKTARVWAFNKAQMYAGAPTVQVVTFDVPGGDFAVMPSNARLQTGTPPPGRPNLFVSSWQFTNALTVYKFHVDWNSISLSTFTGPDTPLAAASWPNAAVANAGQPGTATAIDVLQIRAMVQNQYTNFGGTESLWVPHTVRRPGTFAGPPVQPNGTAAPRWYQANVTGGTVAPNLVQAATWDPDGAQITNRFMPSLALDRAGNMAMGYSVSSAVNEPLGTSPASNCTTCVNTFPSIMYAGRLAADPVNTFSQTEQTFFTGTASQTGTTRWGDYSAMTLDPDGCTFWYTTEYANPADQTANHRWLTKFGSIGVFPGCTPVAAGGGTLSGTVTASAGGAPISGAAVQLGARSTTTNGSGVYTFPGLPAGTYPTLTISAAGFNTATFSSIVVTDGNTTTQDCALTTAPISACLTDTTQPDFQAGVATNVDPTTSPGDVILASPQPVDQSNTAGTTTGTGFGTPNWTGQTFIAGVTGSLVKAEVQLFCNGCGATPPDLTLSVRNTSAGLPTGPDLASATVPGSAFASGGTTIFAATFGSPATLTSGTQYALILRPVSVPAGSGYFWIRSSPSTYASGSRVLSADSGGSWSADTTRDYNFKTYMSTGFAASGNLVSGLKDANPEPGRTPTWGTISWNATVPANTAVQFQAAASNSPFGPFNFVGPDSTSGTFFTNGGSLAQFNGSRYLKYKAVLTTSDGGATPTLNDVTVCFTNAGNPLPAITLLTPSSVVETSAAFPLTVTGTNFVATSVVRANGADRVTTYVSPTELTAAILASDVATAGANPAITVFNPAPDGGTSNALTLTVTPGVAPNITTQPISQTIASGTTATMCVSAGGTPTLTYQWYIGSSGDTSNPIGGATSNSFTTPSLTTTTNYWVRVSNGFGHADSNTATISIGVGPAFTTQPQSQTIASGSTATFTSAASGTATVTFQWYVGASGDTSNPIGGATSSGFTTPSLTVQTSYWVRASNTYGTADSNTATVSIGVAPTIATHPQSQTIASGSSASMAVFANGTATLTYQWYAGTSGNTGSPIGGATASGYMTPPLTTTANYWVRVTNPYGSADSNTATITIGTAPNITTHPASQTIPFGSSATMTVLAGGTPTLTYQWYVGTSGNTASPVGGATTNSLTVSPTTTTSYWVRVSSPYGTANSNTATISITCGFSLSPISAKFGPAGGSGSAAVTTQPGCGWNATTTASSWIVFGTSAGTGSGTMTFTAQPNATGLARSAAIVVGGQAFVVTERVRDTITLSDFDGDSKSDVAVFRPSAGGWYVLNSTTGSTTSSSFSWGLSTDTPVPGDYDGDGRIDPAIFRPSTGLWTFLKSSTGYGSSGSVSWGLSTDVPAPGDYDGDGRTDPAVYRPSTGTWLFLKSTTNYTSSGSVAWGLSSDVPVAGDYDGDGKTDPAIFRPSSGVWAFLKSSTNFTTSGVVSWGLGTDVAVPGDYDGDGKIDPAVYRPSTGGWYFLRSSTGYTSSGSVAWGLSTDVPAPADYDGDGKADPAIFRPSSGLWAVLKSSTGYTSSFVVSWGLSSDSPLNRRP